MLYTRTSFINYLTIKRDCEIINIRDGRDNVITIRNGPAKAFIWANGRDRIDYEMIVIICNKLWLDGLPSESDLEKIE